METETTTPVTHVQEKTKNKSTSPAEDVEDHSHRHLLASEFPAGLKVLLVDDDETCLLILAQMLQRCMFRVTTCQKAKDAIALLRDDKCRFDIVVSDVHMPEIDGLKILEIAALEMDLPVVLVSSDDNQRLVMEGILGDACDYLIKPITMNNIKTIWQHVVRRRRSKALKGSSQLPRLPQPFMNSSSIRIPQPDKCAVDNHNNGATASSGSTASLKKSNDEDDEDDGGGSNDDSSQQEEATTKGKKRMVWTQELHEKFLTAFNFLAPSNVVPTKILECMQRMGVQGITRENVASHLQKYRMQLRKQEEQQHDQSLLLHPSSSYRQFHPPFTVGSWGSSSVSAPTSINNDHNATLFPDAALVGHHHQINNNTTANNNNISQLFESGCVVFTQPDAETSESSLPINITAARELLGVNSRHHHHQVLCDQYLNLQSQLDYHQMGYFHEAELENVANDGEDYIENSWQLHQYS